MNLAANREKVLAHLVQMAWQGGDVKLQAGCQAYLSQRLADLESEHPGIGADVRAEFLRLRKAKG